MTMKKTSYIPFIAAAVLLVAACESKIQPDEEFDGESAVCFMPMLGDASTVMPDSDPASRTKASDLVSADGSISLALGYEVCDGIADQARNDGALETKGTQLNTTGSDAALGNYSISSFKVAAWKGSSALVPANTVVTKGTNVWTTSTSYLWGASQDATFYAYANLPSSGAAVTCTSSAKQTLAYTTLPTTAAAQNDILLGFYQGKGRYDTSLHKGGIADIKFHHPLTAVQFKLGTIAGATTVSVTKISISKVHAGGTADMTPPATGSTVPSITWTPTGAITTVTLGDGTSALTIDSTNGYLIGEPFILIPQVLTTSPVTVTVELSIDGTATTLAAKINTGEWKAGKTNIYTLTYGSNS